MKIGNVFATDRIVQRVDNGGTRTWKAGKGKTFMCLMLGIEDLSPGATLIQPSDVLNALGWVYDPKKDRTDKGTLGEDLGEMTSASQKIRLPK